MAHPTPLRPDQRSLTGRIEREMNALMVLARRWSRYEGDLERAFQVLNQTAAVSIEVERAGIWTLERDGSALVCRDLYEASRHRHSRGFRFTEEAAPAYFSALRTEEWIQAVDAHSDPRTSAFAGSYLVPHGIGALADVALRVGGQVAGVLRVEHVGGPRTFQTDEMMSAALIANFASLALEFDRANYAESRLDDERAMLGAAVDASGVAVMVLDASGSVIHYNRRLLDLWDMPETLMGPAGNGGVRIQHIAARTADPAKFIARFRRVSAEETGHTDDVIELVDGRRVQRASCPLPGNRGARAWSFRVLSPGADAG